MIIHHMSKRLGMVAPTIIKIYSNLKYIMKFSNSLIIEKNKILNNWYSISVLESEEDSSQILLALINIFSQNVDEFQK